jgi:DUF4097 and DUF4098 domain-containing protein YvlB
MREFIPQDRITLRAKLAAGAMFVTAEPRETAAVEVQPYDGSSSSREAAEQTMVEMRGSDLHIEAPEQGWRLRRSGRIRVDVRLPEDSCLSIRTASADSRFEGRFGDSSIDSASGDVTVGHVAGTLTVHSASGDVRIARVDGPTSVDTGSGDVFIASAVGDVVVGSSSGDLTVEQSQGSVRARTASGDVRLDTVGHGDVDLHTASGDVRIGIPAGTSVWLDLATMSGSTRSDLDHAGDTPAGGVANLNLRVRTASGDIELRRVPVPASA